MDVTNTRFGTRARDRDDFALQVHKLFKRFLEEYTDPQDEPSDHDQSDRMDLDNSNARDDLTTATNDSFASASSRPQGKSAKGKIGQSKYSKEALELLSSERNTLFVDFKDIEMFDSTLADDIICEYYRFYPYLCRAMAAFVREEKIRCAEATIDPNAGVAQRMAEREQIKRELDKPQVVNKDYYVGFYNFAHRDNIRDLSSTKVGILTRVTGQVIRTHSVHPELILGCFKCEDCLSEQYSEQQFRYTQPAVCINESCANRTRYKLILEKSRFTDFQRLRIQETQQELPRGCIPRSFDVIVRGADQVECIQPGDQCDFIGTLISVPDVGQIMSGVFGTVSTDYDLESGITGLKALGVRDMTYSLAFLASACIIEGQTKPCLNTDSSYREGLYGAAMGSGEFSKEEIYKIEMMRKDGKLLENLSKSLFSSIHGCEDVKQGILLQLLGGVAKHTPTGINLRGDINICLVGDPSTAKSQFLKIVTDFSPVQAVYASGKASSASGLTAAVVRDTDGGFVIEAGALMLADRGICCIDEFDKMDLKDQVALHEAMEQQTISITKAGVSATLNARTSILAAANPIGGTYDQSRTLKSNLSFSLPIMSRFDLFFILIDPRVKENDRAIADRIFDMHVNYANSTNYKQTNMMYPFEDIRLYLRFARRYHPKVPVETESIYVKEYVRLRTNSKTSTTSMRITVRQLESLIRLSEAIARAHCDELVRPAYIKMASELIEKTLVQVGESRIQVPLNADPDEAQAGDQAGQDGNEEQMRPANGPPDAMYEGELESQRLPATQKLPKRVVDMAKSNFRQIAGVLTLKLSQEAERGDKETPAMPKSDLVEWYLHQCVSEISTESELIRRKQLAEGVLARLIEDHVVLEISDDGKIIDSTQPSQAQQEDPQKLDDDRLVFNNPLEDVEEYLAALQ